MRVEHYNNAEKQGRAAARSMLGASDPYDYVHSFWSDQYDDKLEYAGYATRWDEFVDPREPRGAGAARVLPVTDGCRRRRSGLDRGGDPELDEDSEMAAAARLVRLQAPVDADALADEQVDLWSLA